MPSSGLKTVQLNDRISFLVNELSRLLDAVAIRYEQATPRVFPETPGIYLISDHELTVIRAGKTNATLRQRLYQNHLMGSQDGNLPVQLINSGICGTQAGAKEWIRKNCSVRWLEVENARERGFLEHFMLAVLEPRFCDKNKQD
jgi:hypothetical protein